MRLLKFVVLVALLASASSAFSAVSAVLSYEYSTPYAGGATLTIYNNSNQSVDIKTLSFTNNADIAGTPWGSLYGWQSVVTNTASSDSVHIIHTVNENPVITIAAHGSAYITYNVGTIHGALSPNKAAMDPIQVMANGEDVPVKGICSGAACKDPGNGKKVVGYFINWAYWRSPAFKADDVRMPYDKINTLHYAFAIFDKDGKVSLYDQDSDSVNLPIISQKRKQLPYLNASLSFGGWSWASTPSGWQCQKGASPAGPAACFSQLANNPTAVTSFVKNAVSAMSEVNFNGIDIDWEYPTTTEDAANFVNLLKQLREALDQKAKEDGVPKYNLTVAVSAGIDKISDLTKNQWQEVASYVDSIGVMTYDFHGDWDKDLGVGSDFQSAMELDKANDPTASSPVLGKYDVIDAMQAYLDIGISSDKLLVGIPMYGRMVNIAPKSATDPETYGLYRTITGAPTGEFDNQQSGSTGMLNYNCIQDKSTCGNGYQLPALTLVDPDTNKYGQYAKTPWGYTDVSAGPLFVTYDDYKSASYKANWVKNEKQFGGVMLWDLTGDFIDTDDRSIVNAIYKVFNGQ
jgi:chitinase